MLFRSGSTAAPGSALNAVAESGGSDAQKVDKLFMRTLSRAPTKEESETWATYIAAANAPASAPAAAAPNGKNVKNDPLARLGRRKPNAAPTDPKRAALEDLQWALLNSSEFLFNH